ncbi:MAG: ATP-binding protein [Saprospiraceae bacterium]|nr:ATP-binding protein [Saprospiraceae bacterium]
MNDMIGRDGELSIVDDIYESQKSELLLVIGRRRVGKTFFIEHAFSEGMAFHFTGTKDAEVENQIEKFGQQIEKYFDKNVLEINIKNWAESLNLLSKSISGLRKSKKKRVIFFDEFPWIDTHKSNFLNEFTYWWNNWASKQNIIVVVAGSATSYLIDSFEKDTGGLHNRVTKRIEIKPFSLYETKLFLTKNNITLDHYHLVQLYMVMGGIPYYLREVKRGESATQAINRLCFENKGLLKNEFDFLYKALFKHAENHISVVKALASKHKGLTRQEIVRLTGLSDGGGLSKVLNELVACSFVLRLSSLDKKSKEIIYKLVDEYTLFYFNFIEGHKKVSGDAWLKFANMPHFTVWQGYAFENICFRHMDAIKSALGISGMYTENVSYYHKKNKESVGFQIDMIIDRADNVMNICEMKFYNKEVTIDRQTADKLRLRRANFKELSKTRKLLLNTLITTYGVETNEHSLAQIDSIVTMDQFFSQTRF